MVGVLRKYITIVFAAIVSIQIVLPALLSLAIYSVKIYQHECIARHDNNQHFVELSINEEDRSLQFIGEDEICYKGYLYDVAGVTKTNGTYKIKAIADGEETSLQHMNKQQQDQVQKPGTNCSLPFVFVYYESPYLFTIISARYQHCKYRSINDKAPALHHHKVNIPPPWLV